MNKEEFLPLVFLQELYKIILTKKQQKLDASPKADIHSKNILSAWEAVEILPFNPHRARGLVKRENQNVSNSENSGLAIPKTRRAVSRAIRTAICLVTRTTLSSKKLKQLLSGLSEGFQQTIADKTVEEEAHRHYRQLVGKERKAKTSDDRKLTQATVVTSETVLQLRDQPERVDAAKAAHKGPKQSGRPGPLQILQKRTILQAAPTSNSPPITPSSTLLTQIDEADGLWEEMEALELGKDSVGGSSGGGVRESIWPRCRS